MAARSLRSDLLRTKLAVVDGSSPGSSTACEAAGEAWAKGAR